MLRREGHAVNKKRVQRIYREEKVMVRRRGGRKRTMGTRRPLEVPLVANQRWSLELAATRRPSGRVRPDDRRAAVPNPDGDR